MIFNTESMERIEDLQLIVNHIIKEAIKSKRNISSTAELCEMNQLLPYRHKANLFDKLQLSPFPKNRIWNGSIIYLDRDGVLNIGSENYINNPEELIILPGVADSIARLKKWI